MKIIKPFAIISFILFFTGVVQAQALFIGHNSDAGNNSFAGDQGGGTPLFGECVSNGASNMWINWRVYVDGTDCSGVGTTGAGQGSKCRVIVRGMSPNGDPQSLVASEPVCIVNGTYLSDLGGTNDDVYVANLNTCNPQLPNGRYSVEIQCDCVSGDYTTNTAIATWIYNTPSPYYPGVAGSCNPPDPLNNIALDSPGQLEYINIGDADVYRTMVILNGLFLDLGKFQPGNPALPGSLHDFDFLYDPACVSIASFPPNGFCPNGTLTLDGGEVNTMKRNDCDADVSGARIYYRVYKAGTAPPAFDNIALGTAGIGSDISVTPYSGVDNCPGSSYITVFPNGGSCQSSGCQTQQRWQTRYGGATPGVDLLDCSGTNPEVAIDGPGTYVLELYTETDVNYCGGDFPATIRDPETAGTYYTTTFNILDEAAAAQAGCAPIGVSCVAEQACDAEDGICNITDLPDGTYDVTYTFNGSTTTTLTGLTSTGGTLSILNRAPGLYSNFVVTPTTPTDCAVYTNAAGCTVNEF